MLFPHVKHLYGFIFYTSYAFPANFESQARQCQIPYEILFTLFLLQYGHFCQDFIFFMALTSFCFTEAPYLAPYPPVKEIFFVAIFILLETAFLKVSKLVVGKNSSLLWYLRAVPKIKRNLSTSSYKEFCTFICPDEKII